MSSEGTSFYSQGEEAITRKIELQDANTCSLLPGTTQFTEYFELSWTISQIKEGDSKRVRVVLKSVLDAEDDPPIQIALQFPDELLQYSVPIFQTLKRDLRPGQEVYILADTSYGSPCRLPVIYVFGRQYLDVEACAQNLVDSIMKDPIVDKSTQVVLEVDVIYAHCAGEDRIAPLEPELRRHIPEDVRDALAAKGVQATYSPIPRRLEPTTQTITSLPELEKSEIPPIILYVGPESLHLTNLLITHSFSTVYRYDASTQGVIVESAKTNKMLMRRYTAVQKARDADVIGILVGTLGVASYLPLITHIRATLKKAQKKSYTISVGKLNPAKLANFMEIECFVLVACPENSIIDSKEFLRPIVTPYELQISLQAEPTWSGRYVLDFNGLLNEPIQQDESNSDDDTDKPVFSFMTGTYRHAKKYGAATPDIDTLTSSDSTSVVIRSQDNTVARLADSAAADFLSAR
ncbi:Diphthamide biosynthesis protein 2 [Pleurotus pulmonarius]|nr:Diphthamide biosynthesis protein 2 [Pleurotus pulmonarius]